MTDVKTIETRTHGRYLVRTPAVPGPWPVLVGFHGYRETADIHLDALARIPGSERWLLVAVQGLHLFYTREQDIVASWMTRQNRDEAIGDNIAYVGVVLDAVDAEYDTGDVRVFAGFSQGGAMAYRAAARYAADALIVLAADVPPELGTRNLDVPLPPVLIGRGTRDTWYTDVKHAADLEVLRRLEVTVDTCVFDGGHEWSAAFYADAARVLRQHERITT